VALDEKDGMKRSCAVNLHNAVTVSQERLGGVARLGDDRLSEVCAPCASRWAAMGSENQNSRPSLDIDAD
jgi:hypothetical protein